MLLGMLAFMAVALTCTMFMSRQMMLGFASALMWALVGAQAYTLSTVPWGDLYFYIAFSSFFGMTIFCSLAAYGLREREDAVDEEDDGSGSGDGFEKEKTAIKEPSESSEDQTSDRTRRLRDRANRRKTRWGSFK